MRVRALAAGINGSTGPLECCTEAISRAGMDRTLAPAPAEHARRRTRCYLLRGGHCRFYDQDWDTWLCRPHVTLKLPTRMIIRTLKWACRRRTTHIGSGRPSLLFFRLVSRHTIESKILQRASERRRLGALVIAKRAPSFPPHPQLRASHIILIPQANSRPRSAGKTKVETRQTITEMAAQLLEPEGEHIEVVPSTAVG